MIDSKRQRQGKNLFVLLGVVLLLTASLTNIAEAGRAGLKTQVRQLDLSRTPSTDELIEAGQLGGFLTPTSDAPTSLNNKSSLGKDKSAEERLHSEYNLKFGQAIQLWNEHKYPEATLLFKEYSTKYPDSPWAAEATLHAGCEATFTGKYTDAEGYFQQLINQFKNSSHEGGREIANKARGRMAILKIAQNDIPAAIESFSTLKKDSTSWRDRTYAATWLQRLAGWNADHLAMLTCGTQALAYILEKDGRPEDARQVLELVPTSDQGFSFQDLRTIAGVHGYPVTGLALTIEELPTLPLPAIVQLHTADENNKGHYWVLQKVNKNGRLSFYDPQSGRYFHQKPEDFAKQWQGNAIVFTDDNNLPGTILPIEEMSRIAGGCCGVNAPPSDLGNPGEDGSNPPEDGPGSCSFGAGAPVWAVNMINMNLYVQDTPLWYSPAIGPEVSISLSYNSQSSLGNHEPFGNKWQFNYASYLVVDPGGTVTIFLPDGRQDTYMPDGTGEYILPYSSQNKLTFIAENHFELQLPDNTIYEYAIPPDTTSMQPFMTSITDAHGLSLIMDYNSDNQLSTITDATGQTTNITYNADGLVSSVTDPFGRTASFTYDEDRNLISLTDMGGYSTSLEYDDDVYLSAVENSRGRWDIYIESSSYDKGDNESNPYPAPGDDMWGNYRITISDPMGNKKEYRFDGLDYYSKYTSPRDYIEYVDSDTNNYKAPGTTYYFANVGGQGEINAVARPAGSTTYYAYDYEGNRISESDPDGRTTTFSYNQQGMITSETAPMGNSVTMTYADNGFALASISDGISIESVTYNQFYDPTTYTNTAGEIFHITYNSFGQRDYTTDPLGIVTEYIYDDNHRLQQIRRATQQIQAYTYDAIGRVRTSTDATGLTLTYDYNDLNAITQITYPDSSTISYIYADCCPYLLLSETDRGGRITSYEYDKLGRLAQTTNPEGGVLKYEYDPNGNIVKLLDTNSNATTFAYDLDNRLISKTNGDGNSIQYSYTDDGKTATKTNARGTTITYSYNENGLLIGVDYSDTTPDVSYGYDMYERLLSIEDGVGTWGYTYDSASRLASVDGPWQDDTISYQYDRMGRRSLLQSPLGNDVSYTYDNLSRLSAIESAGKTFSYAYQGPSTLIESLTHPNGVVTTYQTTDLKQLSSLSNSHPTLGTISQYGYTYNQLGLRTSETSSGTPELNFTAAQTSHQYNGLNQRVASQYDQDGNLLRGYTPEGFLFVAVYDAENRLVSIEYTDEMSGGHAVSYLYSENDQLSRVQHYENDILKEENRFLLDGFTLIQERDGSNRLAREYTWQPGRSGGIGGLLNLKQDGADYSYLYDGKGNVTGLTDSTGAIVASYGYDTFGIPMAVSGSLDQPFLFSTKAYEATTGLSYYGYRFYAPRLGRWLNRDPLEEAGGMNLYGFVGQNPVNLVDPWGLMACSYSDILYRNRRDMLIEQYNASTGEHLLIVWIEGKRKTEPYTGPIKPCSKDKSTMFQKLQGVLRKNAPKPDPNKPHQDRSANFGVRG